VMGGDRQWRETYGNLGLEIPTLDLLVLLADCYHITNTRRVVTLAKTSRTQEMLKMCKLK